MAILEPFLPRLKILRFEYWYNQTSDKSIDISSLIKAQKLEILSLPLLVNGEEIVSKLPLLSQLTIAFRRSYSDIEWLNDCSNLQELTLIGLHIVEGNLASNISNIRKLTLEDCVIFDLEDIDLSKFPRLKELHIVEGKIANSISFISKAPQLKICILDNIEIIEGKDNIDMDTFLYCPNLEVLDIGLKRYGSAINRIDINVLSALTKLRELKIEECSFDVSASLENFTALKKLTLKYIPGNTKIPTLPSIKYGGLKSLTLDHMTNLTSIKCGGLKSLTLKRMNITNISHLDNSLELQEVNIVFCILTNIDFLLTCKKLKKVYIKDSSNVMPLMEVLTEKLENEGFTSSINTDEGISLMVYTK